MSERLSAEGQVRFHLDRSSLDLFRWVVGALNTDQRQGGISHTVTVYAVCGRL
jgi:hypothetical protein